MTQASPPIVQHHLEDGIAIVTIDNPPVNAISAQMRAELWAMVDHLDADDQVQAVVLTCAGRTFIAGADVREFGAEPVPPHLPDLVAHIEAAKTPWVAAIHGTALGGGLEIALGCAWRVAAPAARLGLPEVNLGVMPGASGTVRTPRLIGVPAAVSLVTSGRPIGAAQAQDMGLIDAVIDADLVSGAVAYARRALEGTRPVAASARPVAPESDAFWQDARKAAAKAGHKAPLRALESVRFASEHGFEDAMAQERAGFLDLRADAESAALRSVFFAERAAPRPERLRGVDARAVAQVAVIGGGTMGAGIASACLNAGYPVVVIERDAAGTERARAAVDATLIGAVKRGKLTEDARAARLAALRCSTDYADLADVDLVIEAVFEEIGVKRDVFAQLDAHCRPDAILATNTSYLDPRDIAQGVSHPERVIGLHFFSPAHIMKLLEIVPLPDTAPEVLAAGFALAKALAKIPVEAGICDGFIGNRILKTYRAEAEALVIAGTPIADIDAAMRAFGFRMGPFEAQDLGGLDIAYLQREGARAAGQDVPETLGDILVQAGRKGQKTGGGWYDYAEGERRPIPSEAAAGLLAARITGDSPVPSDQIAAHLVGAMAREGHAILREGIATSASDIDLVEIHGYGFPRWKGGPMHWAAQQ